MTQFAAAANPMFASFTDHPSFAPYQAIKPDQPLEEVNPAGAPMAGESSRMDFGREDRAPNRNSPRRSGRASGAPRVTCPRRYCAIGRASRLPTPTVTA